MKRDMDLVRRILLKIEESPTGRAPREVEIEGYTAQQIKYHIFIMIEGGLVEGVRTQHLQSPGPEAMATRLTWEGHEFLDAARQDNRWEEAKSVIKAVGGATIDVWKDVLVRLLLNAIGQ